MFLSKNKFFVCVLLLSVIFYFMSAPVAKADEVVNAVTSIGNIVVDLVVDIATFDVWGIMDTFFNLADATAQGIMQNEFTMITFFATFAASAYFYAAQAAATGGFVAAEGTAAVEGTATAWGLSSTAPVGTVALTQGGIAIATSQGWWIAETFGMMPSIAGLGQFGTTYLIVSTSATLAAAGGVGAVIAACAAGDNVICGGNENSVLVMPQVDSTGSVCKSSQQLITPTFYIPSFNQEYVTGPDQYCSYDPASCITDDEGKTHCDQTICNTFSAGVPGEWSIPGVTTLQPIINETHNKIALYRVTAPISQFQTAPGEKIDNGALAKWFMGIPNVGVMDTQHNFGSGLGYSQWGSPVLNKPEPDFLAVYPYSQFCSGDTCTLPDSFEVPENSYVFYAAKILGNYTWAVENAPDCYEDDLGRVSCSANPPTYYSSSAKFLTTKKLDSGSLAQFPWIAWNGRTYDIGNAFFGPVKTASSTCPAPETPTCTPAWTPDSNTVCSVLNLTQTQTNCPELPATQTVSGTKDCPNTFSLTVTKSGTGTGKIKTNAAPYVINCGTTCSTASAAFETGLVPFLIATPDEGSTFEGWSGDDCMGSTGKKKTSCMMRMDKNKTLNAEFSKPQSPPGDFNWNPSDGGVTSTCNQAMLSWTASAGADRYEVRKQTKLDGGYGPWQVIATITSGATSYTDSNVTQHNDYKYQVKAYNNAGEKEIAARSITTPYCAPTANLSVTTGSLSRIYQGDKTSLTWSSTHADSCTASASKPQSDWTGSMSASGVKEIHPSPPPSVTYKVRCSGPGGEVDSNTVTIDIDALGLPGWKEIIPR